MPSKDLTNSILMKLVHGHAHDSSSMFKEDLISDADGGKDYDEIEQAIEEVVKRYDFLEEWGHYQEPRIHLDQSTGEIVDVLVEDFDEVPAWLYPELSHVPNQTWEKHGINPY